MTGWNCSKHPQKRHITVHWIFWESFHQFNHSLSYVFSLTLLATSETRRETSVKSHPLPYYSSTNSCYLPCIWIINLNIKRWIWIIIGSDNPEIFNSKLLLCLFFPMFFVFFLFALKQSVKIQNHWFSYMWQPLLPSQLVTFLLYFLVALTVIFRVSWLARDVKCFAQMFSESSMCFCNAVSSKALESCMCNFIK